jgi:NAD(P)H-dependent FMN reductase
MTFVEPFNTIPHLNSAPGPMPRSTRVVALVGSLRHDSLNAALLRTAQAVGPAGMTIEPIPLDGIPFFDGDIEAAGDPPAVTRLKRAIADADGLVVVSPEYNRSIPAILKNAIDWASRGPALRGKPVVLMGASSGRSGAKHALDHAASVLAHTGAIPFERRVGVPSAGALDDETGQLTSDAVRAELAGVLGDFRDWIAASERPSIGRAA